MRGWLALGCVLLLAGPAWASDVRRVEVVGAAPLGGALTRSPRDLALRAALRAAVRQVAVEALGGAAAGPEDEVLTAALGEDPFAYATRFRVLEDRGERPALFSSDPEVATEYVVVAEVHVDAARVRSRLERAGLLQVPSGEARGVRTLVTVEDLSSWAEVQAVRKLLSDVGARNAVPVEVERGRAVLEVETRRHPEALLRELVRRAPEGLRIEALTADASGLRLRARVIETTPPAAPDEAAAFDTPGPEGY